MDVQRDAKAVVVQPLQEFPRVGEELAVPGVARPPAAVPGIDVHQMPVHVEHADGERDALAANRSTSVAVLGVGVGVVPAPPVAEGEPRQHRRAARHRVERLRSPAGSRGRSRRSTGRSASRSRGATQPSSSKTSAARSRPARRIPAGHTPGSSGIAPVRQVQRPGRAAEIDRAGMSPVAEPPHAVVDADIRRGPATASPLVRERAPVVHQLEPVGEDLEVVLGPRSPGSRAPAGRGTARRTRRGPRTRRPASTPAAAGRR